jgi:hypothetical protein
MKRYNFFALLTLIFSSLEATPLIIEVNQQTYLLNADEDSSEDLKEKLGDQGVVSFSVPVQQARQFSSKANRDQGKYLGYPRDYAAPLTDREKADIRFIVLTLANRSVLGIAKDKDAVEKAGDRIDHLHPLNFLLVVFSDDELKVGIKNIREKGWIWSSFIEGVVMTLEVESRIGNLTDQMLQEFSKKVGVNIHDLQSFSKKGSWEKMVDYLIANVPRAQEDGNRYDF